MVFSVWVVRKTARPLDNTKTPRTLWLSESFVSQVPH